MIKETVPVYDKQCARRGAHFSSSALSKENEHASVDDDATQRPHFAADTLHDDTGALEKRHVHVERETVERVLGPPGLARKVRQPAMQPVGTAL